MALVIGTICCLSGTALEPHNIPNSLMSNDRPSNGGLSTGKSIQERITLQGLPSNENGHS